MMNPPENVSNICCNNDNCIVLQNITKFDKTFIQ